MPIKFPFSRRRTGPTDETLCIEGKLEIQIAEIGGSSAQSTGRICENFSVVPDTQLNSTIVEFFLKLVPPLGKRVPRRCLRLSAHSAGSGGGG